MLPGWRRVPCSIAHSDVKGRYIVTNEEASPGDVLMEDMPLVCTIDFESFPREIIRAYDSLPKPDPALPTNLFPALHPARVILFSFTCPIQMCRRVHVIDTPLYSYLKHLKRHTHPIPLPADVLRTYQTLSGGPCLPILSPHNLSMPLPQTTNTSHPNNPSLHTFAPPQTPLSPLHPCAAITPFLLPLLPTIAQLNRVAHACGLDVGFPQALCGSVLSVWVDAWHAIVKRPVPDLNAPVPDSEGVLVTAIPGEGLDSDARLHPLSLDPYSPYSTLSLLLKPRPPFKHLVGINASRDSEVSSGNNDPEQSSAPPTITTSFRPAPTVSPLSVFAMAMQPDAPMRARTRALYLKLSRMIVDILPMSLVAALGPGIATFTQNVQVSPKDDDFNHCVCESCVAVTDHGSCFITNVNDRNQQSPYVETSSSLERRPSPSPTAATTDSARCAAPQAARETLITLLAGRTPSRAQLSALPTSIPHTTHANHSTHTTHATMANPESTDIDLTPPPPAPSAECNFPSIIDSYTPPMLPPALATASPAGHLILALHTLCDILDTNVFNADGASLPVDCGLYGKHMRAKDAVAVNIVRAGDGCAQAIGGGENTSGQRGLSLTSAKRQSSMSDDVTQHRNGHTIVPATTKFTTPLPLPLLPIPESGIFIFRIKIDCLFPRVAMMEHACLPVAVVRECHGDDHGFLRYLQMSAPSSSTSSSSAPPYSSRQATNSTASPSPAPISSPPPLPTLPPTVFRVVASLPLPRAAPVAIAYRLISGLPRSQRHKQTVDSYGFPCGCVLCQGFDVCRGCVVGIAGRQGGRQEQDGDGRESSLALFLPIHPENSKKLGYSDAEEHDPAETPEDDVTALVRAPDGALPLTTVFDPALKHRWLDCDLELIVRGRVGRSDPDLSNMTSTDSTSAGSSPTSHILCSYRCIPKHLKQTQSLPHSQLQPSASSQSSSTVSAPLYRPPLPSPSPSLWLLLEYLWWQVQPSLRAFALTRALMHAYYTRQGWQHASISGSEVKPLLHIAGCTCEAGSTAALPQKCLSCRLGKIPIFPENIDIPEPEEDTLSLTSPLSFPMPLPPVFSLPLPSPEQYVTAIGNPDQTHPTPHPEFPPAVPSQRNSFRTPTYAVSCAQQCSDTTPANPLHLLGMPVPVPLPVSFLNPELQVHWVTLHSQAEKYFRERVSNEVTAVKKNRDSKPARGKKAKPEKHDFREIPVLSVSSQHYTLLEAISQVFGMIHSSLGMPEFRYRVDIPETSSGTPFCSADDSKKRIKELISKKFPSEHLVDGSVCASLDSEFTPHLKFPQLYSLMTSSTLWKPSPSHLHQLPSAPDAKHPMPSPSTSSSLQDTQHSLTPAISPSSPASQSTALPLLLLLASLQATQLLQYGPAHWAVVDTVALRGQVCSVLADAYMHRVIEIYDAVLRSDEERGNIGHAFRDKVDHVSFMREMLRRTLSTNLRALHLHQHQRHTLDSLFKPTLEQSNGTQDQQRLDVKTLLHSLSVLLSLSLRWRGAACALLARARVIGAIVADADKSRALQNMHGFQLVLLEESLSIWDGLVDSEM